MAKIPQTRSTSAKTTYNILPDGDYPARIVRFIGLGVQDQPERKGEKKDPAFKCSIQFELIGVDATGVDGEGKAIEARPSCQFKDYFLFPGAKRGGVFDLCKIIDPTLEKVPGDLDWFLGKLDSIVNVTVGHYMTKTGEPRNKVVSVGAIPSMFKSQVGPSRCDQIGFDPYVDSPEMMVQYSRLFKFQRDILTEAHDREHIPFAGKEPMQMEKGGMTKPLVAPAAPVNNVEAPVGSPDFDDDVPF